MFSNGAEYRIFMNEYCCKCSKFKVDSEGIPHINSCSIEKKIAEAMFISESFPRSNVYFVKGKGYICDRFKDKEEASIKRKKGKTKPIKGQMRFV